MLERLPDPAFDRLVSLLTARARCTLALASRALHRRVAVPEVDFVRDTLAALCDPHAFACEPAAAAEPATPLSQAQFAFGQLEHWRARFVTLLHNKWLPLHAQCLTYELRHVKYIEYIGSEVWTLEHAHMIDICVEVPTPAGDRAVVRLAGSSRCGNDTTAGIGYWLEFTLPSQCNGPLLSAAFFGTDQPDYEVYYRNCGLAWRCLDLDGLPELLEYIGHLFPLLHSTYTFFEEITVPIGHFPVDEITASGDDTDDLESPPKLHPTTTSTQLQRSFQHFRKYQEEQKALHKPKPPNFENRTMPTYLYMIYEPPIYDYWTDYEESERLEANWGPSDQAVHTILQHIRLLKANLALQQFGAVFQHFLHESGTALAPGVAAERVLWVRENVHIQDCDSSRINSPDGWIKADSRNCKFTVQVSNSSIVLKLRQSALLWNQRRRSKLLRYPEIDGRDTSGSRTHLLAPPEK
ncbi:hypothetical protein HDU87_001674 [Geranomyces variabilis]|uniref:F-box domain-containing protein n=1 Tax=Geranomyces variabilis TaxID=109894 RepID=A0AAD5TBI8_9FUNG|nr:hypothetical protein HDU87_001674 [Geranomyces variabilis]